ncbi:tRNA (adenosine(37)-N6)-threonylcarbamoyltransferase complex ATPase subunit type 1 TsaE [Rhodopirellula sp. MGV]|uniref:tRNA (adenosine(37)-N6)-threonylcarbamoyltransferase complex ATPase subunit type 1 TsaE n=1 Tax=Rhodopirellula sp. MGV TaxID=2023130 RepID=UPI000B963C5D|nr:tRNA (adenosine(37)-N6)-threonylcarbamoyltransferase complex ATPase subunit type 1 TsaE [Rhodopirellula sp. MGV]OYP37497.1 tRNA (adenosine(37)-N6)-threonylcarbamoyltransferase complex ATPase subunit type 1 TsaE [Rhodopirellula sp. MGV]PNY37899.1 tRNA (adenosine(37)-N6)-threonylcarbamoyltransferase complex ATPase subunit type 1 TsaE [Rhodopirellula baltica]
MDLVKDPASSALSPKGIFHKIHYLIRIFHKIHYIVIPFRLKRIGGGCNIDVGVSPFGVLIMQLNDIDLPKLHQLAERMVRHLPKPLTVGLVGTLGAGKTTFVQALAAAAGVDSDDVTSPTFTLLSSYQATIGAGEITLHHMDAYRVHDEDEFLELGVEELFDDTDAWVLIEWADKVQAVMPPETLWITIEATEPRSIHFACESAAVHTALQSLVV